MNDTPNPLNGRDVEDIKSSASTREALEILVAVVTRYWEMTETPKRPVPENTRDALEIARHVLARGESQ